MIPNKFTLHGCEWSVKKEKDESNIDNLGSCNNFTCTITIQEKYGKESISNTMMESTFFHEFIHAALNSGEYHDLSADEKLVSHLGNCLHQYLKTKS